jgi:hypothetical protein
MFFIVMFLEQWMVLEVVLFVLQRMLKRKMRCGRNTLAAVLGSLMGCAILQMPDDMPIQRILFLLPAMAVTVWILNPDIKMVWTDLGMLWMICTILGGSWIILNERIKLPWIMGLCLGGGGMICLIQVCGRRKRKNVNSFIR